MFPIFLKTRTSHGKRKNLEIEIKLKEKKSNQWKAKSEKKNYVILSIRKRHKK